MVGNKRIGHVGDTNDKWCMFFNDLHYHPRFQSLKNSNTFALKETSFATTSPSNNPPIVVTKFINMVVRLLDPPPSMTYCKFRSMGTIYAPILNHIIMY
jgi:hypothetical protein